MWSVPLSIQSLAATLLLYGSYKLTSFIYGELTSQVRSLPGPKSSSLLLGNFKELTKEGVALLENYAVQYGKVVCLNGVLARSRLYVTDTTAVNHILSNAYVYPKPESSRYTLSRLLGQGILIVEGDAHKLQRKIMNPAFGSSQIREFTEIFIQKSMELRDSWATECSTTEGTGRVNIFLGLNKVTLDVIGLTGFNYQLDAVSGRQNELADALLVMFTAHMPNMIGILRALFPVLRFLPEPLGAEIQIAQKTFNRVANELINERRAAVANSEKPTDRDLLSLLMKSNISADRPADQRLSDQDVIARTNYVWELSGKSDASQPQRFLPLWLLVTKPPGNTATMWALFALSQDQTIQTKLRNELFSIDTDNPTMDQLNALPYLDQVVREALRVHPPVAATARVSQNDDVIPISTPVTDRKGTVLNSIRVKKGQEILIPICAINKDKSIWGEDAEEFRPERWDSVPEGSKAIPGVWSHMLTFLGGPRSCIGFRFSITEMKALLFTLIRAFEFELAVPATDVYKRFSFVAKPGLVADRDGPDQLPLLIRPYIR